MLEIQFDIDINLGKLSYNLCLHVAGVVGFEPTVHGIKTRGYSYQELSGFSQPFKIVLMRLMFLMHYQENHEKCCQKCCQKAKFLE